LRFFFGQDHLSVAEWALRGVIAYLFLILVAKCMGQRSISQLRFLDFVTALLLGNILAHPLSDEGLGMPGSMTTTAVLVAMYSLSSIVSLKWEPWRKFLEPFPLLLVRNGKILVHNLKKARITDEFLLTELRLQKVEDVTKVAVALWEPGGNISVFLQPQYEAPTREDMNIKAEPFVYPIVVIKEGKIKTEAFELFRKSEQWLMQKLKDEEQLSLREVLLATLDENETLTVLLKKEK
jgi:uncharacterized membrane protein YcaP (DUF421 family)